MNNYYIILASGQSKRFNSKKPKQFNIYKNKVLFKHSVEKAIKSKLFKKIILVVNNKNQIKYLGKLFCFWAPKSSKTQAERL